IGKPRSLGELQTLSQTIDGRYWECKSEVTRQVQPSRNQSSTSKSTPITPSPKPATASNTSAFSSAKSSTPKPTSDLSSKLGKDRRLTSEECKRHFDLKLCMFCGAAGHVAKDCQKSTSRPARGREARGGMAEARGGGAE
ncbi:hypothetical protein BS17DRAFT_654575, partial [Gyrodon lividus]